MVRSDAGSYWTSFCILAAACWVINPSGQLPFGPVTRSPTAGNTYKKVKVAHTRLPSVEFRNWSRFLAVSLQVTLVMNPAVGCHYFPPGLQLPSQPLRGLLPILLLGEQRHDGCEQFAKNVTRQRRGCDLNAGHSAPESSTLTTRLPSHQRSPLPRNEAQSTDGLVSWDS